MSAGKLKDAIQAYVRGHLGDAAAICQAILQADMRHYEAAHLLGLVLTRTNDFENARKVLKLAASIRPFDGPVRLTLAEAMRPQDPEAAWTEVRRAVLADPGNARAWGAQAVGASAAGAGAAFGRAANAGAMLAPGDADLHFLRSLSLVSRDQVMLRGNALKRAILLQPVHHVALQGLAEISLGDVPARLLKRLCIVGPGFADFWFRYAAIVPDEEGTAAARRALVLDPAHTEAWRQLSGSGRNAGTGVFRDLRAVRALSICRPLDYEVWSERARMEDRATAGPVAKRAGDLLAFHPDAQLDLARKAYEAGDVPEAEAVVLGRYFANCDRLLRAGDRRLEFGEGLASFLRMTLFEGRVDLLQQFVDCAGAGFDGTGRASAEAQKMRYVLRALADYRREAPGWNGDRRLVVSVPVWGEKVGRFWLEQSLPAMMAPGNRGLWDRAETLFVITTTPATRRMFEQDPAFRKLMGGYAHVFIDISTVLEEWVMEANYIALVCSQWVSLVISMLEAADCFQLCADHVFAERSLGHIAGLLDRGGTDLLCTVDLPVSVSAMPLLDRFRGADGTLDIPEEELARIFLDHPSARVLHYLVDPEDRSLPSDPSRLNARLEGGLQLRSTQPQLAYVTAPVLDTLWVPFMGATDNGAVDWALESGVGAERMAMLNDPGDFVCGVVEFDDRERAEAGYFSARIKFDGSVAHRLKAILGQQDYFTAGRQWSFSRPVSVRRPGAAGTSPAAALLDEVARMVPVAPPNGLTQMLSALGRPAFRRYLEATGARRFA